MAARIVQSLPSDIISLSDKQLFENLRKYDINIGPVLPSTRSVYQRKLYALKTGQNVEVHSQYPPADSDDDDEEDDERRAPREPQAPQPRPRATERAEFRGERRNDFPSSLTRRPLHAGIGDQPTRKKAADAAKRERGQPTSKWGRWSLFVFVIAVAIVVGWLVFKNMESEPASNIPDEIEMEV